MRLYQCDQCRNTAFFHNLACVCGTPLAYDPDANAMRTQFHACKNRAAIGCNWKSDSNAGVDLCRSCAMTEIIPDIYLTDNIALWSKAEAAKRWVLANLSRWGWFTDADPGERPRFHLLSEHTVIGDKEIIMGHDEGLITINVEESDPVTRLERQTDMSERLRTMIAHFRHEIAHFLFVRLSRTEGFVPQFRALFGDETADYGDALKTHYDNGPPTDWAHRHITKYASSHPHEDWAETTAHVMHLTDLLDSAAAAGLSLTKDVAVPDPYAARDSRALIQAGAEYGMALNHVNRSIGLADIYPFVISNNVREKLIASHQHISRDLSRAR
jgi:hypothetical protein